MKDIKSVIIGFLLATCMFLLMGYTKHKDGHFDTITAKEIIVGNNKGNSVRIGTHYIMISDKESDSEMQIHSALINQYKQSDIQNSNFLIQGYHNRGIISLYDSEGREGVYLTSAKTEGDGMIQTHTLEEKIKWKEELEEFWEKNE